VPVLLNINPVHIHSYKNLEQTHRSMLTIPNPLFTTYFTRKKKRNLLTIVKFVVYSSACYGRGVPQEPHTRCVRYVYLHYFWLITI